MERLTDNVPKIATMEKLEQYRQKVFDKLYAYEDTELSPAEITKLREEVERLEKESEDKERAYLEEFNLCKETIRELNFYKFYNACSQSDCPCKYQEQCDRLIKPRVDLVDQLRTENKRLEKALELAVYLANWDTSIVGLERLLVNETFWERNTTINESQARLIQTIKTQAAEADKKGSDNG